MTKKPQVKEGCIVIERINWFSDHAPGGARPDRVASVVVPHDAICERFRGIEGWLWPELSDADEIEVVDGLALPSSDQRLREYVARLQPRLRVDALLVSREERDDRSTESGKGEQFLGYDFGFLSCDSDNYSVVFNEVIYGTEDNLRVLSSHLNENLLFESRHSVELLRRERTRLVRQGRDLETDNVEPQAFRIFALGPCSTSGRILV